MYAVKVSPFHSESFYAQDQSVSEVAVESLAKLFANGHCRSKNAKAQELYYEAFARITLEWFGDESRANRSALKHACLARALPYYASQSLCVSCQTST